MNLALRVVEGGQYEASMRQKSHFRGICHKLNGVSSWGPL